MPRAKSKRVNRLFPLALSPQEMADALGIHIDRLRDLMRKAGTPIYTIGLKRRVLVQDAVAMIRDHVPYETQR
jgi:hypothetical protein